MRCKIFGHKWQNYFEDVPHITSAISNSHMSVPSFTFMVNTEFRICERCYHKQERQHWTTKENVDWKDHDLSKEQSRDKKLKELGI